MPPQQEPILFLWAFSPWASKVVAYLALRGIPHSRCEQPITLPRPDLAALGIQYRRIPLLAFGRDVYCDTLLILEKLEQWYPASSGYKSISSSNPTERALEKLFEKWTDVVVFKPAAAVIPSSLDLMKDPGFQKDREELWGRPWHAEEQDRLRPAGLANMRADFDLLEETLADGRQWISGNDGPKLVDIHACWIFDWLFQIDAFDNAFFNKETYPKTFAWRDRYADAIAKAKEAAATPPELEGKEAIQRVLDGEFTDTNPQVENDPIGLKAGQLVDMYPIDTGYNKRDSGKLVLLNAHEAAVEALTEQGKKEIRIHYPRWNFEIVPQKKAGLGSDHVG